jgi:hypothetical protein
MTATKKKSRSKPRAIRSYSAALALLPKRMVDLVPETPKSTHKGATFLDHITVSEEEAKWGNLRNAMGGDPLGHVEPGRYARLVVGAQLMMTDTQMERITNASFLMHAHGHVLIAGLGLGMILHAVAKMPEVKSITVIEKDRAVIQHIRPTLPKHRKLRVVQGDIFEWEPAKGEKYQTVYFDIWPNFGAYNWDEMKALRRRFRKWYDRSDPDLWVGSWREAECRRRALDGRRHW